jgi:hypothetical protein
MIENATAVVADEQVGGGRLDTEKQTMTDL